MKIKKSKLSQLINLEKNNNFTLKRIHSVDTYISDDMQRQKFSHFYVG